MTRLLIVAIANVISLSAYAAAPAGLDGPTTVASGSNAGFSLLKVADTQGGDSASASTASGDMQIEEAVTIVQGYMSGLSQQGMDGTTVHDESELPDSKSRITTALLMLIAATPEPDTRAQFKNGVMVLAFFQPDVGSTPVALDQVGPGQQTWQKVVEANMQALNTTMAEQGL